MKFTARFLISLILVLVLVGYGVMPLIDKLTYQWFSADLHIRSKLVKESAQASIKPFVRWQMQNQIDSLFQRILRDERLLAIGFCDTLGVLKYHSEAFPESLICSELASADTTVSQTRQINGGPVHVSVSEVSDFGEPIGRLILVHDLSFAERRSTATKRWATFVLLGLGVVVGLLATMIARHSWHGWIRVFRSHISGDLLRRPISPKDVPEIAPLVKDLRALIKDVESERRSRDENQVTWNPRALKDILRKELAGDEILVVSNRQPYIHTRRGDKVTVVQPASGLVTALEPILRACSGTWIAHGSGNADREVVDKLDHIRVPPGHPSYQIRRVWLSEAEESGYYYGFANEGLWPLCHIAHTRPIFRSDDWYQYIDVNEKFARAVAQEAKTDDPVVLVQDYHFALLPRMVRQHLPNATIITFWHIPWPNPEAFGICPWREELLRGLLGSTILGFHTRFHCLNFVNTVDQYVECRIDKETSTVSYGGKITAINPYPISIEWPVTPEFVELPVATCRKMIREQNGLPPDHYIGIGVDRLDYTKGILERFLAVERLLELYPEWRGRFTFIQIAAPSRSIIDRYKEFDQSVRSEAERINTIAGKDRAPAILLKIQHHEPKAVFEHFRASDVCMVTSLHDGMNLVAKEFVAARDDEQGTLLLSQFTGASRELPEAMVVNPYNIDQCAAALDYALRMPENEQRERMRSMRGLIKEFNVYRWAGRMLIDAARIRQRNRLLDKLGESAQYLSIGHRE